MKNKKELLIKWRQLNIADLNLELAQLDQQQFKLKMQHAIGELKDLHKIKLIRKNIARLLGILKEKS